MQIAAFPPAFASISATRSSAQGDAALRLRTDQRPRPVSRKGPVAERGFTRMQMGPTDPRYAALLPVTSLGLGYNDYKAMEIREMIEAVAAGRPAYPDFRFGHGSSRWWTRARNRMRRTPGSKSACSAWAGSVAARLHSRPPADGASPPAVPVRSPDVAPRRHSVPPMPTSPSARASTRITPVAIYCQ